MNEDQILDKAKTHMASAWSAEGGPQAALNPAFIDMLLNIGLGLLQNCFAGGSSPQAVKAMGERKGLLARLRVRRAVTESLESEYGRGAFGRMGGQKIVETLLTSAGNAKVEELEQFSQVTL